jgi:hypothetical protein
MIDMIKGYRFFANFIYKIQRKKKKKKKVPAWYETRTILSSLIGYACRSWAKRMRAAEKVIYRITLMESTERRIYKLNASTVVT